MRIEPNLYLIGSGANGFDLTNAYDCNIYLFRSGDEYVLFDAGAGMDVEKILSVCQQDGIERNRIRHLFLTHAHGDHSGGVAHLAEHFPFQSYAGPDTARIVTDGDEDAVSLSHAREGGIYPANYIYRSHSIGHVLNHLDDIQIGNMSIETHFTPGHSHDHVSYLISGLNDKRYLIGGDAIFYGGKIVLQNTYDCSVPLSIQSIQYLATLDFDALLAGHLNFSLQNGKRHVESACAIIDQMGCPPSI
ncbi:MAG: MBL fold metallo-hydrolase [Chloroflexota bacterium]